MSYNIDTWKTKKLENLVIPLNALYEGVNENWKPEQPKIIDWVTDENGMVAMKVEIECGGGQLIKGTIIDKHSKLYVTEIDMSGEGSGSFMYKIFEHALKQATGELTAVCIWEGEDSITRLIVKDGVLTEERVEL